jgi:hypothetical protein
LSRRFAHGRHDVGDAHTLIVSRGVGAIEVALRTFADPDILVVDVGAESGGRASRGAAIGKRRFRDTASIGAVRACIAAWAQ